MILKNALIEEKAQSITIIEVTPEELMAAARKLEAESKKTSSQQEVVLMLAAGIVLKYNPNNKIVQGIAPLANTRADIAQIQALVEQDERTGFPEHSQSVQ